MKRLDIENFLSIKKATINLKRINLFIGPQAKGKSVITKLISFFKEIPQVCFDAAIEGRSKREFDSDLRSKFEAMFPRYAWEKTNFSIEYDNGYFIVLLSCLNGKFNIDYSQNLSQALSSARKMYKKSIDDPELASRSRVKVNRDVRDSLLSTIYKNETESKIENIIYIPAGRSFFAHLQKNVFSFLSSSVPIDHFIKEFGAIYERTRELLRQDVFNERQRPKNVSKLVDDLLCGKHVIDKGQDWIVGDCGKVNVSNSSSGQQEALPLALILSTWPYVTIRQLYRSFVIEEPEAHLFPIAQGQVVSLIATAYRSGDLDSEFIITTHSPYILTAFNNLIQAGNVMRAADYDDSKLSALYSIVPKEQAINFDQVTAYIVDNGTVRPILDESLRLIDANAIDSVSNNLSQKFEKLLDLEFSL